MDPMTVLEKSDENTMCFYTFRFETQKPKHAISRKSIKTLCVFTLFVLIRKSQNMQSAKTLCVFIDFHQNIQKHIVKI